MCYNESAEKKMFGESMLEFKEVCVVSCFQKQLGSSHIYRIIERVREADLKSYHMHTQPLFVAHGHKGVCMREEILRRIIIFYIYIHPMLRQEL